MIVPRTSDRRCDRNTVNIGTFTRSWWSSTFWKAGVSVSVSRT